MVKDIFIEQELLFNVTVIIGVSRMYLFEQRMHEDIDRYDESFKMDES